MDKLNKIINEDPPVQGNLALAMGIGLLIIGLFLYILPFVV